MYLFDRGSCYLRWPQTYYIAKNNLEFLILSVSTSQVLGLQVCTLYRLFVYESGFYYIVQESLYWQQFSCLSLACWDYRLCCHTQQYANVIKHKKQMQPGVQDLISDFLSPNVPSFRIPGVCCHSPSKVFILFERKVFNI